MADDTPLRIDPALGPFDDDARQALDGIIGAGLDGAIAGALAAPVPPPPPPSASASPVHGSFGDETDDDEPNHDEPNHDEPNHDETDDDVTGRLIRPYAMTGGRTGGDGPEIPLEAQVLASSQAVERLGSYRWEAARLLEMVETPLALIEIAARLEVPVGVARVLVGDLVEDGSLIIHLPPPTSSFTSLLEQVLDGVRDL